MKTWIITGAARGFGLEISKAVLASGENVVATTRNRPEELAAKLNHHPNLHVGVLDITDGSQARRVAAEAVEKFHRLDVLVNNAGFGLLGGVEEVSDEEAKRVYETNVFGLLKVIRAVLPHMRKQRFGHVINFSSVGGLTGSAGWGIYVEVDHLAARRHNLAHQTPAHLESVGDNLLTDPGDLGRFRAFIEDQPQFFLAVGQLLFGNWLEVKDAFEKPISEPVEQPNGWLED
ncbi:MAG TPA: SDR family NAD(P)-dependent oxidoreductase [Chthoniobacterales bacterium]|jgi:NAD(P)-dependent dehydrogenase (short-subunit alcohol dehydrogenase family)|nr:SDR family NAD(P)-dependent oxidoreductase [Chthoniobacterales bacterium]